MLIATDVLKTKKISFYQFVSMFQKIFVLCRK